MELPENIVLQFLNPHKNNKYFLHAKETFDVLEKKSETDFISDDVSYAVKTLERFYKGVLEDMSKNTGYIPYYNEAKGKTLIEYSHNLKTLRHEIELNQPEIFPALTHSERIELNRKLTEYTALYTDASYEYFAEYSKFKEILTFTKKELSYIDNFYDKGAPYRDQITLD